ncbi:5-methyltetrahydropteroyltriglutamate--homocysteine S-methyltransferase [Ferrovibrio sp.]|uniref:5-methyltetrahydropteroyltriglutamate-- homocysteine S-methyltransferase n=1 Tax=Ferrovibrio sp. TaxID=1917215 RepID=UPI0026074006|nr:5-methyltetrahydropteroyltriglutamate--homocysteine S-methyltransferase [Ferrovibrio sp.]
MQRTKPPFRADHVGSLLRTAELKEARAQRKEGKISAEQLKAVEDKAIEYVIRRQEEIGLKSVTDGEFRRSWWHFDFLGYLDGVEYYTSADKGIQFAGVQTRAEGVRVTGKIGYSGHPMIEHFKFLKAHTRQTPKMTIPSPSVLHFRSGRNAISRDLYPNLDEFFRDLGQAYKKAVQDFAAAGCRYLQLDETNLAYLCDPEQRELSRQRGDDPDSLPMKYAEMINTAIADRPADMVISMHLCRGNFRSTYISKGGYEPVAEVLLDKIKVDGYFMEYDNERSGGFEPLRYLPKGHKTVVLGLVTTKTGSLESKDALKRRIEQASKFADLDQLCLSPQCGFASTEEGNVLAEDEQWAKLRMIVELAEEVWGKA